MTAELSAADTQALRATVQTAFDELSSPARVRSLMATAPGWDAAEWGRLCRELGLTGIAVPEADGGSGMSAVEAGLVFEAAGRTLLCAPLLAVAGLSVPLLLGLGDAAGSADLLPGLLDGSLVATVATADRHGRQLPDHVGVTADGDRLTGQAGFVIDGASADVILVPACGDDGLGVYAVDRGAAGLTVTPLVTLDQTRKQAHLDFAETPGQRLGRGDATAAIMLAVDTARALLACEQAGVAARSLELTVEFAKTRIQFGRPIGSFQAIKQKAADLLIKVESAKSAANAAVRAVAADDVDRSMTVSVAAAYCSEAASAVTAESIQLHGGIGFTWEHDAHLYFKRALASEEMLGTPREHYSLVADHLDAKEKTPS